MLVFQPAMLVYQRVDHDIFPKKTAAILIKKQAKVILWRKCCPASPEFGILNRGDTWCFLFEGGKLSLWIQVPPKKIQKTPKLYPFRAFLEATWIHRVCEFLGIVYENICLAILLVTFLGWWITNLSKVKSSNLQLIDNKMGTTWITWCFFFFCKGILPWDSSRLPPWKLTCPILVGNTSEPTIDFQGTC